MGLSTFLIALNHFMCSTEITESQQELVKNQPANAGDTRVVGLIPGSGRFPGVRNVNSLQYSCLENLMVREACWARVHGVTKSWT